MRTEETAKLGQTYIIRNPGESDEDMRRRVRRDSMPHDERDRLLYFLIKLHLVTPAATRTYLKANAARDVSFFIFRYAHNMGNL